MAAFAGLPSAVKLMLKARAHALNEQPHRLAFDVREPFHAQDIVCACGAGNAVNDVGGALDSGNVDDETLEIVVVVLALLIVMGRAGSKIRFCRRAETKQNLGFEARALGRDDLDRTRAPPS